MGDCAGGDMLACMGNRRSIEAQLRGTYACGHAHHLQYIPGFGVRPQWSGFDSMLRATCMRWHPVRAEQHVELLLVHQQPVVLVHAERIVYTQPRRRGGGDEVPPVRRPPARDPILYPGPAAAAVRII